MAESKKRSPAKPKLPARLSMQDREPIHVGTDEAIKIYSNSLTLQTTPWDIKFTFGQIGVVDAKRIEIRDEVIIFMSPQHAKATLVALQKNVERYEAAYGTLPNVQAGDE